MRLTALLTEYESLRQESLDTLGHRLTVVNFTFAALSVVIGAVVSSDRSPLLLGLVALVFVPQAAKAGLLVWLGEYARSQRAGRHLSGVEDRINDVLGVGRDLGLDWEGKLTQRGTHMSLPYRATIAFTVGVGWVGAAIGLALLVPAVVGLAPGPAGTWLVTALVLVAVAVEWWFLDVFLREWAAARTGTAPAWRRGLGPVPALRRRDRG